MEGPISKFMLVQQSDSYWHPGPSTAAFKSPDLIELNSDTERNSKPVEPLNYSSSQDEVETEDDCCDAPDSAILGKEGIPGMYDVTSNDEESCHLLQTEDDSDNSDSEHVDNSSKSSGSRTSSSAEATISDGEAGGEGRLSSRLRKSSLDNYWDMTAEQEKYYTDQFILLESNISGLLSGKVAKAFFEKSKLPHTELREIWQLADITKDGCLDLNEFKLAMHLVVLRKHGLPIPSHFYGRPLQDFLTVQNSSTMPPNSTQAPAGNIPAVNGNGKGNGNGNGNGNVTAPQNNTVQTQNSTETTTTSPKLNNIQQPSSSSSSSGNANTNSTSTQPASEKSHPKILKKPSKEEWTTFDNEPVNFSSTCDTSGLVAPVPVRLTTPEDALYAANNASSSAQKAQALQLKSIQRPKLSGHHPKVFTGTIAPPPPPRRKTHVRSSSLDLNKLTISSDLKNQLNNSIGPEAPVVRGFLSPSHQRGAFSVYQKPHQPKTGTIPESRRSPSENRVSSSLTSAGQLRLDAIDLKSDNIILTRISTQLLEQLSGLQSKRKSLSFQIKELVPNPVGSASVTTTTASAPPNVTLATTNNRLS